MKLEAGMILYHGSYAQVNDIDLGKCALGKDFGKGFYLTSDSGQAKRFVPSSLRKAQSKGEAPSSQAHGFVSEFRVLDSASSLSVHEFEEANQDWLRFISLNRRASLSGQLAEAVNSAAFEADVVIGPVANDTTNPVITTYLNGLFGPVESPEAAEIAIARLLPERLSDQFCFRTAKAVDCLESIDVVRYEL